jgi:cytochrome bd-type quinol oxidase subunit 2
MLVIGHVTDAGDRTVSDTCLCLTHTDVSMPHTYPCLTHTESLHLSCGSPLWALSVLGLYAQAAFLARYQEQGWTEACLYISNNSGLRVAVLYGNVFLTATGILYMLKHDVHLALPDWLVLLPLLIVLALLFILNTISIWQAKQHSRCAEAAMAGLFTTRSLLLPLLPAASVCLFLLRDHEMLERTRGWKQCVVAAPLAALALITTCVGTSEAVKSFKSRKVCARQCVV